MKASVRWWPLVAALVAGYAVGPAGASSVPAIGAAYEGVEDREPGEAQALAEAALHAEWNRDKTTELRRLSTRLRMNLTRIVARTSAFEGRLTGLSTDSSSLQDRLLELRAEVTEQEIRIRLPGSVLFDFDSEAIRPDAEATLESVVEVINGHPSRPVRIEGHTDAVASDAYNQTLSERRAASVQEWLGEHGVDRGRLIAHGLGETRPVASNETAEGRQQNRRVEVTIERGEGDG